MWHCPEIQKGSNVVYLSTLLERVSWAIPDRQRCSVIRYYSVCIKHLGCVALLVRCAETDAILSANRSGCESKHDLDRMPRSIDSITSSQIGSHSLCSSEWSIKHDSKLDPAVSRNNNAACVQADPGCQLPQRNRLEFKSRTFQHCAARLYPGRCRFVRLFRAQGHECHQPCFAAGAILRLCIFQGPQETHTRLPDCLEPVLAHPG